MVQEMDYIPSAVAVTLYSIWVVVAVVEEEEEEEER